MPYFEPYIDVSGLHIPLYSDIRDDLIDKMKTIFGDDIYIEQDTMDYQQISIMARKIYDAYSLAQVVYNNRTPLNAIGVGLDNVVAYAGIRRKPATASTVQLTLTGDPSTVITKGEAHDQNGNVWLLPDSVEIPSNGTITVEAISQEQGEIEALPNTITIIGTPIYGWYGVTNNQAAAPGTDVETDAELRARFEIATRAPSLTVFESIEAGITAISEVKRVKGYENDTGNESTGTEPPGIPAGLPAHSITFVVEGGEETEIATAIYNKKTPGCYTNGTTEVQLTSVGGNVFIIRYYKPTYNDVYVKVSIKKLAGYNEEYQTKIKDAISDYILNMELGDNVYKSIIWSVATSAMESIKNPAYSVLNVQFATVSTGPWSDADVMQQFYNAANTTPEMVTIEVS